MYVRPGYPRRPDDIAGAVPKMAVFRVENKPSLLRSLNVMAWIFMIWGFYLLLLDWLVSAAGIGIAAVGKSVGRLPGLSTLPHNYTNCGGLIEGLSADQFRLKNGIGPGGIVSPKFINDDLPIKPLVSGQWSYFYFTNTGTTALPGFSFSIGLSILATISIQDIYCSGDRFVFNVQGGLGVNTNYTTSAPTGSASCSSAYTTDPSVASSNSAFSKYSLLLLGPATYTITIYSLISPFTAGAAVIKAANIL